VVQRRGAGQRPAIFWGILSFINTQKRHDLKLKNSNERVYISVNFAQATLKSQVYNPAT
jgi:hypothetical protein